MEQGAWSMEPSKIAETNCQAHCAKRAIYASRSLSLYWNSESRAISQLWSSRREIAHGDVRGRQREICQPSSGTSQFAFRNPRWMEHSRGCILRVVLWQVHPKK